MKDRLKLMAAFFIPLILLLIARELELSLFKEGSPVWNNFLSLFK